VAVVVVEIQVVVVATAMMTMVTIVCFRSRPSLDIQSVLFIGPMWEGITQLLGRKQIMPIMMTTMTTMMIIFETFHGGKNLS
jgi:hypothetical protein